MSQHRPERGSDVEAWIKRARDRRLEESPAFTGEGPDAVYDALDNLLDDYRERADLGRDLSEQS